MVRITKNIFIVFFISMNILFFSCSTSNNSKLSENIIPTENIEIHTNNNLKINNEGNNSKPVLIDFYSDTWLTCKASLPGITTLKSRVGNHAKFITYDVKNPDSIPMLKKYNASLVPSFIVLDKNEKIVWEQFGGIFNSAEALDALFDCYTEKDLNINPC